MLDIIKSYISNKKYYIIMMNDSFYIKNYDRLINITANEVLVEIAGSLYKCTGSDLTLTRSLDRELEIKGIIESIIKL